MEAVNRALAARCRAAGDVHGTPPDRRLLRALVDALARDFPEGFAALIGSVDDDPRVRLLVSATPGPQAERVLKHVGACDLRLVAARFPLARLRAVEEHWAALMDGDEAITSLWLDARANRVRVGVADDGARARLAAQAEDDRAVVLVVEPPART